MLNCTSIEVDGCSYFRKIVYSINSHQRVRNFFRLDNCLRLGYLILEIVDQNIPAFYSIDRISHLINLNYDIACIDKYQILDVS